MNTEILPTAMLLFSENRLDISKRYSKRFLFCDFLEH